MENRIELWVFPTGNIAVYRGSAFIPTEQLTEEERLFVLDRVCDELKGKDLNAEIKKYTENLYHETFGNGQSTLDEFDWEDISTVIEDTARHFYSLRPQPNQEWSEEDEKMKQSIIKALYGGGHFAYEPEINWLKSIRPQSHWKPTKAMLEALDWARSEFHPDCPNTMGALNYLYKEIEKLYYDGN